MKLRNFTLIFIFGLFIFLLPSGAKAFCNARQYGYDCHDPGTGDCCIKFQEEVVNSYPVGITSQFAGQFDECPGSIPGFMMCADCWDPAGWEGSIGKIPNTSRSFCTVVHAIWNWGCDKCIESGVFEKNSGECIQCSGKIENRILGTTSEAYDPCPDPPGIAGDGNCESACGADDECDEKDYGLGVPASGGVCDNCVFVPPEPDLRITDIWPDGSTVRYTIKNEGDASAGASNSYLYVDGSYETSDSVSSLSAGASSSESFSYDWVANCTDLTDTIKVCADGGSAVSESNEGNNCRTETWNCPLPNLQISDIEEFGTDKNVHYTVHNDGDASTGSGFYCSLYVDGTYEEYEYTSSALGAGLPRDDDFSGWECTPGQTYSIEVCADDKNGTEQITESDEYDNCRTENLTCPVECVGKIDAYPESATEPCDFTIDIYNVYYCQGLTWEVTRDGSYVDSGTVTGNTDWDETTYDYGVGVDSSIYYRLYIDNDQKDYDAVSCSAEECNCTGWTNQSCGYSTCNWYERGRTRICTPSGCDIELECFCDESCCSAWIDDDCGPAGGCAETEMHQTRDCGTCSYSESQCVSDPSCGGVITFNPPVVVTIADPTISEDPAHPGQYRAILTGFLDSLGYDPGICTNCKCIVWFEWGTSGTAGVSGSYGNSNTPVEMTTEDDYFYYTADNLDPGTAFKFEAFAKNGGSW